MILKPNESGLEAVYQGAKMCFSCGQPLNDTAKVWWNGYAEDGSGETVTFALHAGCAAKLAVHLGSDALKADLANGKRMLDHGSPLKG